MAKKIKRCKECGNHHYGKICPDVKKIKFFAGGDIEDIEFYSTYDKRLETEVERRLGIEKRKWTRDTRKELKELKIAQQEEVERIKDDYGNQLFQLQGLNSELKAKLQDYEMDRKQDGDEKGSPEANQTKLAFDDAPEPEGEDEDQE